MKNYKIRCHLKGVRPLMFDRYAGDNNTQLRNEEKLYMDPQNMGLIMPSLNILGMLCGEGSKSVINQAFPKSSWSNIRLGFSAGINIDPFDIPILGKDGKQIIFSGFNDQVRVLSHVARIQKGKQAIPNPKQRPTIYPPWSLYFVVSFEEVGKATVENLRQAFSVGGMVGLGTFRPFFGRYTLEEFELI